MLFFGFVVFDQHFLFNSGCIGEIRIFFAADFCPVYIPVTIAIAGIYQRTIVGTEIHISFLSHGFGYLFCGSVIHRTHKNLTAHYQCYLFSIGRIYRRSGSCAETEFLFLFSVKIICDVYSQFLRFRSPFFQRVDFTVVSETNCSVVGCCKKTYGIIAESGQLFQVSRVVQRCRKYIVTAAFFTQEIKRIVVGTVNRISIFTRAVNQFPVCSGFHVIFQNIAGHRRSVVFTPCVLETFQILIQKFASCFVEIDLFSR